MRVDIEAVIEPLTGRAPGETSVIRRDVKAGMAVFSCTMLDGRPVGRHCDTTRRSLISWAVPGPNIPHRAAPQEIAILRNASDTTEHHDAGRCITDQTIDYGAFHYVDKCDAVLGKDRPTAAQWVLMEPLES